MVLLVNACFLTLKQYMYSIALKTNEKREDNLPDEAK